MNCSKFKILLSFFFVFLLYSCGNDPDLSSQPKFKRNDNTVIVRFPAEPDRLNPLLTTNTYAKAVYERIFLYLMDFHPQTFELEPQLVKSRPVIEEITEGEYAGGVAYTFEILDEAVWDDGSPVTAADVAFTLKVLFNPKVNAGPFRSYMEFIKDFEIDEDNLNKFTIYTDQKYILSEAAVSNIAVYPEYIYDPERLLADFSVRELCDSDNAQKLAEQNPRLQQFAEAFNSSQFSREKGFIKGTGPYQFEEWVTGQRIVLTKKENWWGDNLRKKYPALQAFPEKLIYNVIPDPTTAMTVLKDEGFDVTAQIDSRDFTELKKDERVNELFNLQTAPFLGFYYIGLNMNHPKLSDKRVRRALAHLVDVDEIIENVFYGLAERMTGPIHPSKSYFDKSLQPIKLDVKKARTLFDEAGWTDTNNNGIVDKMIDGELVEMNLSLLISSASKAGKNIALLFQDNAKRAGVNIEIVPKEFTVMIDDIKKREYELYNGAWGQDPAIDDPKQLWHTDSDTPDGTNRVGFGNAESDRIIDEIRITLDEKKRNELFKQFQQIVYEEQPYIFMITPQERLAIHKRFEAKVSAKRPGYFPNEFVLK
ncbi:MAG: ABC transporter substrate-binding protein [Bacteroidetes bacterium]|nr:ABC transporter substrate-binding protein [Bacteroidota bacterium]